LTYNEILDLAKGHVQQIKRCLLACTMEQIQKFFTSFIGQMVWQVRRGHGSFLTMEFGAPHLSVREPIVPNPDTCGSVRRNLQRRHVDITGDWHFWVQYGEWRLPTDDGALTSDDSPGTPFDECLRDLEGQRLVAVEPGTRERSCAFSFDLGGSLEIWPSIEIPDDQWSLYSVGGDIVTCDNNGLWFLRRLTWSNQFISLST
jgi:hypothetical protein